nr:unnamed protein product [Digitaria exilis]
MEQREATQPEEAAEARGPEQASFIPPKYFEYLETKSLSVRNLHVLQENEDKDLKLSSRVVSLLFGGDISTPAQTFEKWLSLVRKRSGAFRPSGFPHRGSRIEVMPSGSFSLFGSGDLSEHLVREEPVGKDPLTCCDQPPEISLWERLGNASTLDIESSEFSWDVLSSLHHTEHSSGSEHSEDEMNKALEVTVNSGGVVFFALFSSSGNSELAQEAAAVIKFSSSKMATQAERLGYEFARLLGVQTPQARVVYNSSPEWQGIKHAAENARAVAISNNDEVGEMTCSELLEALELSRCLLLMSYIHGSPLLESSKAFNSRETACVTASSLGRVLMLDLILRNEDRLPCRPDEVTSADSCLSLSDEDNAVDPELLKEIEQWNEALKTDVIKFCQENNFHSGFFDGTENNMVADAYELKVGHKIYLNVIPHFKELVSLIIDHLQVRLEHIIERIALISDAANTERPSLVVNNLFIGGALAARSKYTLQHLGITHVLCLCSNEIGQSDSQFPDLFEYKNFSISDDDDANISDLFEEASDFIDNVNHGGGKVLVHCFEGKSRSATVVLAYLMLRMGFTLAKAWNLLKKVHRRAQPNDGFAKALLALDKKLHGKVSMDWQHKRPEMKVCPICSKNVGLSTSSLKLHLQKAHKRLSAGSVDSAMTMEIQKSIESLRISRGGSLSPSQKLTKAFANELGF